MSPSGNLSPRRACCDVPLSTRGELVDTEVQRLTELGATAVRVLQQDGLDHYAVAMADPEGNEFDVN
ncbi:MAG: VOC family protein [Pseudonocardiales bacterium]